MSDQFIWRCAACLTDVTARIPISRRNAWESSDDYTIKCPYCPAPKVKRVTRITRSSALESLRRAVASKPEGYVYHNPRGRRAGDQSGFDVHCYYFDPASDAPSCLIGHVLADHGIAYADIKYLNVTPISKLMDVWVPVDDNARSLLFAAQQYQDAGFTWAESVELAPRHVTPRLDDMFNASFLNAANRIRD